MSKLLKKVIRKSERKRTKGELLGGMKQTVDHFSMYNEKFAKIVAYLVNNVTYSGKNPVSNWQER